MIQNTHVLQHYMEMALTHAGVKLDYDMRCEIRDIIGDVDDALDNLQHQISELECSVVALQEEAGLPRRDSEDDVDYSALEKGNEDDTGC